MIGAGGDTPSRHELLSMVKKHSKFLDSATEDASDVDMDSGFWHDVFDLYFIRGKESKGRQDDDLIFFVRKMSSQGDGHHDDSDISPYFVRRWGSKLDKLVEEISEDVDWRRSFYLNLVAHTSFTLTVAICSHQVLRNYQAGQDTLSPIYKIVKTVYASPSRVNFHLDSKKEAETKPAYPDICFAVDDFDSTFDAVVLSSTDHCYCVLLNAHGGAAFPSSPEEDCSSSNSSGLDVDNSARNTKNSKVTLFSGFVSYQMVREAYSAGKSQFGSLLLIGHSPGKTDRLYMKGPGGRGEVEVAVSGVVDQSYDDAGPFSPVSVSKGGFGISSVFRKAASVASVAAKHAYAAASSTTKHEDELIPLKCCLMAVTLPWETIAYDLLFKGTASVNL